MIPIEDVIPAINNRKNHTKQRRFLQGNPSNIAGIAIKPMLKAPELAIKTAPVTPKNATAAGITIDPPKITSIISFKDADVNPLNAMSSESLINDA